MNTLENECKKLLGLPPYNTFLNIACGDGIFYEALCEYFGKEAVEKMLDKLKKE